MSHRKPLIRRTFSQERYEILIKRQRDGKATFNELTELDDIVNRDPTIREIVLIENNFIQGKEEDNEHANMTKETVKPAPRPTLLERLKDFFDRLFFIPADLPKATPVL